MPNPTDLSAQAEQAGPERERGLSRRTLRAMKQRWQRDLARLEAASPVDDWESCDPNIETQRNLGSAIAWIDGLITATKKEDSSHG